MKWLLTVLLLPLVAHGFSKDFKLINDRAPEEFKILFESMKNGLTDPVEQNRLVAYCGRINKGLAPLKRDQALFLLKSEVYKTLLEWKFPASTLAITSDNLTRISANLLINSALYTPFSQWVIESVTTGIQLQPNGAQTPETAMAIKYSRGWLEKAQSLTPKDFNDLTLQLSWEILYRVRAKSLLFQELSSQAIDATEEQTFNIPQLEAASRPEPPKAPLGVSTDVTKQSEKLRDQAEKSVEKIEVKPSDIPAEDLSNAIDKIDTGVKPDSDQSGSGAQPPLN